MLSKKVTAWRKLHKCCAYCIHLDSCDNYLWFCTAKEKLIHKYYYDTDHRRYPRPFCRLFEVKDGYIESTECNKEDENHSLPGGQERFW